MTVIPLLLFQFMLAIASPRASTSPSSPSEDTTLTRRRTRRYDRRGTRRRRRWCRATARPSVGSATAAPGDSTAAPRARRGCRMAPPRRGQDEGRRRGRQRKWPALEADFSCHCRRRRSSNAEGSPISVLSDELLLEYLASSPACSRRPGRKRPPTSGHWPREEQRRKGAGRRKLAAAGRRAAGAALTEPRSKLAAGEQQERRREEQVLIRFFSHPVRQQERERIGRGQFCLFAYLSIKTDFYKRCSVQDPITKEF